MHSRHTWATRYHTGLLIKLTPKGILFSFLLTLEINCPTTTACRDALSVGPPGLEFVSYGNSTSVTTGYGVAAAVPLVPCTTLSDVTVRLHS